MKKLFFLALFISLCNCEKDAQVERLKSALNFEPEFIQQFNVAVDSIIQITGEKGTKITFKPEDLEGSFINDSIQVNLIELTSKEDLLMANAQTISNGKWLISGGAFKIDILSNKKPLKLKKDKTIEVQFPKNTTEKGMQLFYGNRDETGKMNWEETNINLQDFDYYIVRRDCTYLDIINTKRYRIDMFKDTTMIDTLGLIPTKELKSKIDYIIVDNDTLRVLENITTTSPLNEGEKQKASIIEQQLAFNKLNTASIQIYNEISVSRFGWINIDKFASNEETVQIHLKNNNNLDTIKTYLIDSENNTVLNVLSSTIEIPINRNFIIISFGLKGNSFYASKKSVRFNKDGEYLIEYRKLKSEKQIKSYISF